MPGPLRGNLAKIVNIGHYILAVNAFEIKVIN
jgi:hypothetical protein